MQMDEEAIRVQHESAAVDTSSEGRFSIDSQDGSYLALRATDHNEISIMKSDWDEICRKARAIRLEKRFDWNALLWGAAIPYVIEAASCLAARKPVNWFPLALCFCLIALLQAGMLSRLFALFRRGGSQSKAPYEEHESDNRVHHSDLLKLLERVNQNLKPH